MGYLKLTEEEERREKTPPNADYCRCDRPLCPHHFVCVWVEVWHKPKTTDSSNKSVEPDEKSARLFFLDRNFLFFKPFICTQCAEKGGGEGLPSRNQSCSEEISSAPHKLFTR